MKNSSERETEFVTEKTDALRGSESSGNNGYFHTMKPLLNGFLTGEVHALLSYWNGCMFGHHSSLSNLKDSASDIRLTNFKLLQRNMLGGATYTTASLGVFQILTKRFKAGNDGRPISVYQEACCGLTSGAIAACVWRPIMQAYLRSDAPDFNYKTLFHGIHHTVKNEGVLALWKGSGLYIGAQMAMNMGMLASYNRSMHYLLESEGLSKRDAQLCAGIISGFFAAACYHPCAYFKVIKDTVQQRRHSKHAYRKIPLYISRILTPGSGFKFYKGFLHQFGRYTPSIVVQWLIFENISTMLE